MLLSRGTTQTHNDVKERSNCAQFIYVQLPVSQILLTCFHQHVKVYYATYLEFEAVCYSYLSTFIIAHAAYGNCTPVGERCIYLPADIVCDSGKLLDRNILLVSLHNVLEGNIFGNSLLMPARQVGSIMCLCRSVYFTVYFYVRFFTQILNSQLLPLKVDNFWYITIFY